MSVVEQVDAAVARLATESRKRIEWLELEPIFAEQDVDEMERRMLRDMRREPEQTGLEHFREK